MWAALFPESFWNKLSPIPMRVESDVTSRQKPRQLLKSLESPFITKQRVHLAFLFYILTTTTWGRQTGLAGEQKLTAVGR